MTRRFTVPVIALLILAVVAAVAVAVGDVSVPVDRVIAVVARRLGLGEHGVSLFEDQIVWQLRLPRVISAAAVGAGLALCGAVLQSLTRNDLADPFLLGVSSGAAVGAVTVIVLGVGFAGVVGTAAVGAAAFLGALAALAVVLVLARGRGGVLPPARTILAGVAVAQVCTAYTSFIVIANSDSDGARRVLNWTLGSVAGMRWHSTLVVLAVVVATTVAVLPLAPHLDAFAFGETSARSLGIEVEKVRWLVMAGTALVAAVLVAYVGAIGFVGLVVPHVVRFITGPRHRRLLPLCAIVGAIVLVVADTVARSVIDGQEIPVGVVTGLLGAPFFAWLLRREAAR
ncbi:iron chelate uptake ABC transporter family permease subunit [Nocardioides sp.]|uniref:FecCD family ABC transporter permease n=1 Tax=Nocardioides sp. TaxID=35761 RepID=UPI002617BBF0|nr:iron chelate uptake ABC transporter family permease subunit [Nocardioides sp.]